MIKCSVEKDTITVALDSVLSVAAVPVRAEIRNPAMKEYGWYFEFGTGIYGPHKRPIVIRAKNKKALHFFWGDDEYFMKSVTIKGVRPRRFVEETTAEVARDLSNINGVLATATVTSRDRVRAVLRYICQRASSILRVKTGGISNKLSGGFRTEVSP